MPGSYRTTYAEAGPLGELELSEALGTWDWDIPANRLYTDDVLAHLFGLDPEQARTGLPFEDYAAGIHPHDRERVATTIGDAARRAGPYVARYRTCPRQRGVCWVLARGRFYLDRSGRPSRSRGVIMEITERKWEDDGDAGPVTPPHHPLERAADLFLSAREAIAETRRPFLLKLADMLLLELGRDLSKLVAERRQHLN
ncbi:PAS domain-containing protein [Methylobacterium sp. ID0610]|uniref:PAS domain-containing protein n=1 Tax=Methylobacterium carpenticola TaxID=3344827 RepID=UPI0036795A03